MHSRNILTQGRCRFKLDHLFGSIGRRGRELNLCKECKCYLADRENDPKNLWPIFLYSVLFGTSQGVFLDSVHHYSVCGAETLWRLMPQSMRPWWTSEIAKYDAYNSCTIESPAAVFEDKTLEFLRYNNDFNSGQLVGYARQCAIIISLTAMYCARGVVLPVAKMRVEFHWTS